MRNIKSFLLVIVAAMMVGCGTTKTVPITGRQQSLMVSDGEVLSLSTQQYQEFMKTAKLSTNKQNTEMVKRVGEKLATAVTNYLRSNGMAEDLQYYKWQFNLVQNNGEVAGQTVFHFHLHMIPRYQSDGQKIGWVPGKPSQDELEQTRAQICD